MDAYARIKLLIGENALTSLQNKCVAVIGLGGVGGAALEALARCGIQKIVVADYDTVDITNLNRQIIASYETIGQKKVDVWEKRIKSYHTRVLLTKIEEKLTPENIEKLISKETDYMIDACDTIPVKKELIRFCLKNKIKLISVMGTGNKLDPTQVGIMDIRKTNYDPIAKILRKMIKEERIKEKIMVVSSTEAPLKTDSKTIASVSFVPSVAGNLAASYIVNDVIKNEA